MFFNHIEPLLGVSFFLNDLLYIEPFLGISKVFLRIEGKSKGVGNVYSLKGFQRLPFKRYVCDFEF